MAKGTLWGFFYKSTNLIRSWTLMNQSPPQGPPTNAITLDIGGETGPQTTQHMRLSYWKGTVAPGQVHCLSHCSKVSFSILKPSCQLRSLNTSSSSPASSFCFISREKRRKPRQPTGRRFTFPAGWDYREIPSFSFKVPWFGLWIMYSACGQYLFLDVICIPFGTEHSFGQPWVVFESFWFRFKKTKA